MAEDVVKKTKLREARDEAAVLKTEKKELAEQVEFLIVRVDKLGDALKEAIQHLEEHNSEYHHNSRDVVERLKKLVAF